MGIDIILVDLGYMLVKSNESFYEDYGKALETLKQIVEADPSRLVSLHIKIAIAKQHDLILELALSNCRNVVAVCKSRLRRLQHELSNAHTEGGDAFGFLEVPSSLNNKQTEPPINGTMEEIHHSSHDVQIDQTNPAAENFEAESKATEIDYIKELLVDLKVKEQELKEIPA